MTYEFDGDKYQKASTHQEEWGQRLISELSLRGTECILDLGCGDGRLTSRLADLVPDGSVVGIDASHGMIDVAKKHCKKNLFFLRLDINSLNFQEKFDLVFSNATLHWVTDHTALLRKILPCLKDNGALRFNFAGAGNCSHFFDIIRSAMKNARYARYFSEFVWPWYMPTVEEYETIFHQFPFRDIRVWGENADRHFPNSEAMVRWLDQPSLVPFLKCIDQADKESFRNLVVQRMILETCQDNGTYFETFRRINVYARK